MRQTRGHAFPSRRAGEEGASLVEVLVTVALLATAFLALAQVATASLLSLRGSADRTTAVAIATEAVEASRQLPWHDLGLHQVTHAARCAQSFPVDVAGTLREPTLCLADGGVTDTLPFTGRNGDYEVETVVTTVPSYTNARRVTTVVRWEDRGRHREVRTSSVVAGVERG
ncbi:hypothetical protein [Egicoccus halophilus]|uniref:Prepilin-type N-terminal cleavage/methylation domain-containing protein n=1 Tax=Egicoccus halophilus TaxID=1670830 RepID=A0A8J3ABE0_9ACTN|nr:hypothetical protein [Egicoccus halophilus]GGI07369.1 hypothetical protein GCM10011354_23740 [Egicoccus halophilus]